MTALCLFCSRVASDAPVPSESQTALILRGLPYKAKICRLREAHARCLRVSKRLRTCKKKVHGGRKNSIQ